MLFRSSMDVLPAFRLSQAALTARPRSFQKAKKWLDEHEITYTDRHIVEQNPSYEELKEWHEKSGLPLKKFFIVTGNRDSLLSLASIVVKSKSDFSTMWQ